MRVGVWGGGFLLRGRKCPLGKIGVCYLKLGVRGGGGWTGYVGVQDCVNVLFIGFGIRGKPWFGGDDGILALRGFGRHGWLD